MCRRALLGVEKTVVEEIEFDEDEQLMWPMSGHGHGLGAGVGAVSAEHRPMTGVRDDADDVRWT